MAWSDVVQEMDAAVVAAFGEPAITYTTGQGLTAPLPGVFHAAYVRVEAGEAGIASTSPAVFCRTRDLPVDPNDDDPTITVRGVAYRVIEIKPDGQGGTWLVVQQSR